jgi:hypothetical protein
VIQSFVSIRAYVYDGPNVLHVGRAKGAAF